MANTLYCTESEVSNSSLRQEPAHLDTREVGQVGRRTASPVDRGSGDV